MSRYVNMFRETCSKNISKGDTTPVVAAVFEVVETMLMERDAEINELKNEMAHLTRCIADLGGDV